MPKRKIRNLKGRYNDTYIIKQESIPYGYNDNSRYKHMDELSLFDGKIIKTTPGPINTHIFPYGGVTPYTVPDSMKNRIDLIALKFLGASNLYWVICYTSGIKDPLDVPAGKILFIPSISSLRQFPNPLS